MYMFENILYNSVTRKKIDSQLVNLIYTDIHDLNKWMNWCESNLRRRCNYPKPGELNWFTNYSKGSWAISVSYVNQTRISFWFSDDNDRMQFALIFC